MDQQENITDLRQAKMYAEDLSKMYIKERDRRKEIQRINKALSKKTVDLEREIKKRKKTFKALEKSRYEYQEIIEHSRDLIQVVDEEGNLLFVSDFWVKTLGYSVEEARQMKIFDLFDESSLETCSVHFQNMMSGNVSFISDIQAVFIKKDNTRINVEGEAKVHVVNEDTIEIHAFFRDVTEARLLQSQLLHSQRVESLGMLASGITHDINNILAPVMMGIEIIQRRIKDEISLKLLSNMERSVQRGTQIVKQILSFSRGDQGEKVLLNTSAEILDVVELARDLLPKSIRIQIDVPADVSPILADKIQLSQLLLNLIVNARDAINGARGSISLTACDTTLSDSKARELGVASGNRDFVLLKLSDTGSGIPDDIIENIFDPFFTTKTRELGTGLGLSIVASVMRNHEGFIEVDTEKGQGTTFSMYFPAEEHYDTSDSDEASESVPTLSGEYSTILLVEDNNELLKNMELVLMSKGFEVVSASNGAEALLKFDQSDTIDVLITDLDMPVMGGIETIFKLREINPVLPVILMSGTSQLESKFSQLRDYDHLLCLEKPLSLTQLNEALGSLLDDA